LVPPPPPVGARDPAARSGVASLRQASRPKGVPMAVAVEMNFRGATLDQYDQVIQKMGFTPGGKGAPGGISHWVGKTDDGIRVVDVWESKEQYERFAQEQIGPITQEVGFEGPPEVKYTDVHNHLTAG